MLPGKGFAVLRGGKKGSTARFAFAICDLELFVGNPYGQWGFPNQPPVSSTGVLPTRVALALQRFSFYREPDLGKTHYTFGMASVKKETRYLSIYPSI